MRKPTAAEIEKQKVERALEERGEITPIDVPEAPKEEPHTETDEERRKRWGKTWGKNLSDEEYETIDQTYEMLAEEYRPNITSRMELNLRTLAKLYFLRDKAIESDDSAAIKRHTDSIDKIMGSESMRAGDVKPTEALRPDALIDRLEKKGVTLYSQEEVARYINGDKRKYNTSIDVVDDIMFKWRNTQRINNGESELGLLPKELQVEDTYGELQPKLTRKEAEVLAELGEITPAREK